MTCSPLSASKSVRVWGTDITHVTQPRLPARLHHAVDLWVFHITTHSPWWRYDYMCTSPRSHAAFVASGALTLPWRMLWFQSIAQDVDCYKVCLELLIVVEGVFKVAECYTGVSEGAECCRAVFKAADCCRGVFQAAECCRTDQASA